MLNVLYIMTISPSLAIIFQKCEFYPPKHNYIMNNIFDQYYSQCIYRGFYGVFIAFYCAIFIIPIACRSQSIQPP